MRSMSRPPTQLYGIPIVPDNKQFPANCVACNELLAYFKLHNPELLSPASLALFEAYWRDELVPSDPEVIAKYVGPLHPGGAEAVLAIYNDKSKLQAPGVQEMLQAHSKEASETAAFGTPYFIVVKPAPGGKPEVEGFFGSDRMDHIAQFLELPWNGYIPSSASRAPGTETNYPIGDATAMYRQVKPLIDAVQAAAREQGGSGEAAFRQGANN